MPNTNPPNPWLLAARPKTLPAAAAPVVVGVALAYADGAFALAPSLAAFLLTLLLQIAVNLANDYFDGVRGVDTEERLGPTRVTQAGLIPPETVRRAMLGCLAAALVPGGYLIYLGGWPLALAGLAAVAATLAYSGGPKPYASLALGDLFVFLFFGLVAVCGTYYTQAGTLTFAVLLCASAVGLVVTAILAVNNIRDIPTDTKAGKRTLAVVLGERLSRLYFAALWFMSYYLVLSAVAEADLPPLALICLGSLPFYFRIQAELNTTHGRPLNALLARTALCALTFCLLLALGTALGA